MNLMKDNYFILDGSIFLHSFINFTIYQLYIKSMEFQVISLLYVLFIMVFLIVSEDLNSVPIVCGWLLVDNNVSVRVTSTFSLYLNLSNISEIFIGFSYGFTYAAVSLYNGIETVFFCSWGGF